MHPREALIEAVQGSLGELPPRMASRLKTILARLPQNPEPAELDKIDRFRSIIMSSAAGKDSPLVDSMDLLTASLRGIHRAARKPARAISKIDAPDLMEAAIQGPLAEAEQVLEAAHDGTGLKAEDAACLLHSGLDLEELLQAAGKVSRRVHGRTVGLYAPLYLSNECVSNCVYCGFQMQNKQVVRRTLDESEVLREATSLRKKGLRHLLLVAAENPILVDVAYLQRVVAALRPRWEAIDVELGPLSVEGYRALEKAGAGGVTIYQETYERKVFQDVHRYGLKNRYDTRLETPERALDAGLGRIGIGVLLGISEPGAELLWLIGHANYLRERYPNLQLSISLPRFRPESTGYDAPYPVSDEQFLRYAATARLALPWAGFVVSTREEPAMRERLLRAGATRLSAESSTNPGGYSVAPESGQQFEIADHRSIDEVALSIEKADLRPIWSP